MPETHNLKCIKWVYLRNYSLWLCAELASGIRYQILSAILYKRVYACVCICDLKWNAVSFCCTCLEYRIYNLLTKKIRKEEKKKRCMKFQNLFTLDSCDQFVFNLIVNPITHTHKQQVNVNRNSSESK